MFCRMASLGSVIRRSARFTGSLWLVADEDLEDFLSTDPPAAILLGCEKERWEAPLLRYAKEHGYKEVQLSESVALWMPAAKSE
jgi:hypothetical protein